MKEKKMVQSDKKGYFHPTKVFPCDCGTEGVVVAVEWDEDKDDFEGSPFINMAFWNCGAKLGREKGLSRRERIKYAWHILRGRSPWTAMVGMSASTARKLANHIIYVLNKARKPDGTSTPLIDWPKNGKSREDKG
jgi:hypothetical protein